MSEDSFSTFCPTFSPYQTSLYLFKTVDPDTVHLTLHTLAITWHTPLTPTHTLRSLNNNQKNPFGWYEWLPFISVPWLFFWTKMWWFAFLLLSTNQMWEGRWRVIPHDVLPDWLKDNDFLLHGHRPPMPSFRACFKSIFRIHTETGNIWTHLLGSAHPHWCTHTSYSRLSKQLVVHH